MGLVEIQVHHWQTLPGSYRRGVLTNPALVQWYRKVPEVGTGQHCHNAMSSISPELCSLARNFQVFSKYFHYI